MLTKAGVGRRQQLEAFAILNLGLLEMLWNGAITATDAVVRFYNAENCLFVRRSMKSELCDEIMSRGIQLPDLFDILPPDESQREFANELAVMKSLCLKLLETRQRKRSNGR